MKNMSARNAKYGFGQFIDLARAELVTIAKHGRPFVVVMAVEEFERLKALEERNAPARSRSAETSALRK